MKLLVQLAPKDKNILVNRRYFGKEGAKKFEVIINQARSV